MKKKETRDWKCMRKVTPTHSGGRLVNLGGIIPDDWSYVDVFTLGGTKDDMTLQLAVVRRIGDKIIGDVIVDVGDTRKLSRPAKAVKPTI